jgi:hypothetical protein
MKTLSKIMTGIIVITFISGVVKAQETSKQNNKKSLKQIESDCDKSAKEDEKKFTKQGYTNLIGEPALRIQFADACKKKYELDEQGRLKYAIGTRAVVGETQAAAQMQATELAKVDIASQLSSKIIQVVTDTIKNLPISQKDAVSYTKSVSKSGSITQEDLGRSYILVQAVKRIGDNVEFSITVAYDEREAYKVSKNKMRKQLQDDKAPDDVIKRILNF